MNVLYFYFGWMSLTFFHMFQVFMRAFIGLYQAELFKASSDITSLAQIGIVGTCGYATYTLVQFVSGPIVDRDEKHIFYISLSALTFAVMSCLWSAHDTSFLGLCISRSLCGIGSGFSFSTIAKYLNTNISNPILMNSLLSNSISLGILSTIIFSVPFSYLVKKGWQWKELIYLISFFGLFVILCQLFMAFTYAGPVRKDSLKENTTAHTSSELLSKGYYSDFFSDKQIWLLAVYIATASTTMTVLMDQWLKPYLETVLQLDSDSALFVFYMSIVGLLLGVTFYDWAFRADLENLQQQYETKSYSPHKNQSCCPMSAYHKESFCDMMSTWMSACWNQLSGHSSCEENAQIITETTSSLETEIITAPKRIYVSIYKRGMQFGSFLSIVTFLVLILYNKNLCFTSVCVLFFSMGFYSGSTFLSFYHINLYVKNNKRLQNFVGLANGFHNGMSMVGGVFLQMGFGFLIDYFLKFYSKPGAYNMAMIALPLMMLISLICTFFIKPIEVCQD